MIKDPPIRYEIRKGRTAPCELVSIVPTDFGGDAVNFVAEGTHTICDRIKARLEGRAPLAPLDKITVFVDGFGVELDAHVIEGTHVKDGDSVSRDTVRALTARKDLTNDSQQ